MRDTPAGTPVYSADGKERGLTTGGMRLCSMEGCTGIRLDVKWPDGKRTRPCSKGLKDAEGKEPGALQIG
jgi:hypothetical protein